MKRQVQPEEGLAEVAALWSASTADDLHRVLVLSRPVRGYADAHEPFSLFERHHHNEPGTSIVTALLLLTDRRWRGAAAQLVRMIASSDILAPEDLDLLAQAFLAAADALHWPVPDEWFADSAVVVLVDGDNGDEADEDPNGEPAAVARRDVWPPLRRWAAGWVVRRAASTWEAVFARARELDSRASAAVMSGLLDARDVLPEPTQALLAKEATRAGNGDLRRLGYEAVAQREGAQAAYDLARVDHSATVREWASTLVQPTAKPTRSTLF